MSRDPEARFQSARELTDALREVLGGDALQWTSPDLVNAAELTPNSQARTRQDASGSDPRASAQLNESNSQIRLSSGGSLMADPGAATLFANDGPTSSRFGGTPVALGSSPTSSRGSSPTSSRGVQSESRRAESEVIAQLLRSAESEPPRRRSGAGLVLAVAGVALAIGVGAGWVFMKRNDLPRLRPLPDAVPPAHESAAPRAHSGKPPEHAPSAHEEPSATVPATPSASTKPAPTAHAVPDDAPPSAAPAVTAASKPSPAPSVSAAPTSATPDAGWVKPAWAIPDDELPHRVHSDDARDAGK